MRLYDGLTVCLKLSKIADPAFLIINNAGIPPQIEKVDFLLELTSLSASVTRSLAPAAGTGTSIFTGS